MEDVGAKHPWLFNRDGKWYLRARVPKDVPNHPKVEVKRSLGTSDYRVASRLIHPAAADLEQEFDAYRRHGGPPPKSTPRRISRIPRAATIPKITIRYRGEGEPPPDLRSSEDLADTEIRSFTVQVWRDWQSWIMAPVSNSDPDWLNDYVQLLEADRWDQYLRPIQESNVSLRLEATLFLEKRGYFFDLKGSKGQILGDYFARAGSEAYRRRIDRLRGSSTYEHRDRLFDDIPIAASLFWESPTSQPQQDIVSLAKLISLYEDDPKRRDIEQKTRDEDRRTFAYMREFFGDDRPINQISRKDCIAFCNSIISIPKNAYRDFKGLSLKKLQSVASEQSLPKLSNKGANKYIHKLSAILNYAKNEELITHNPAFKLAMPARHSVDDRDSFSTETITKIFSSEAYVVAKHSKFDPVDGAWFWVPLLSLFMGLRLGEACQLHVADIVELFGLTVIKIDDNDLKDLNRKRVKTLNAKRTVPCHNTLLELGFISFVDIVRKSGAIRLFPNEHRGADTYFSPFSKRYSRFLSSISCKTSKTSFHSFRHNCKDALTDAGVSDKLSNAIGGWSDASNSTGSRYGSRSTMLALSEAIGKVSYLSFPIELLRSESE